MTPQDAGLELAASHSVDARGIQRGGKDHMDPTMLQFDPFVIVGYGALGMIVAFSSLQWTIKPLAHAVDIPQKQLEPGLLP